MLSFRMDEIAELINDINIITKIKCVLYDKDFHILHDYENSMCPFCSLVRTDTQCCQKCLESDREGFRQSLRTRSVYKYTCHMGLTETVTPIFCEDEIVGFIMMGQNLLRDNLDLVQSRIEEFPDESKRSLLREALALMKFTAEDELSAMRNVVEMCAEYLYMKKLIRVSEMSTAVLLKNFIVEHMTEPLSVSRLCHEFRMSQSSLYLLSRESFGKSITELIRDIRMERARILLRESDETVTSIAEKIGFDDANYFTKVFRRCTGCTPREWRNRLDPEIIIKK